MAWRGAAPPLSPGPRTPQSATRFFVVTPNPPPLHTHTHTHLFALPVLKSRRNRAAPSLAGLSEEDGPPSPPERRRPPPDNLDQMMATFNRGSAPSCHVHPASVPSLGLRATGEVARRTAKTLLGAETCSRPWRTSSRGCRSRTSRRSGTRGGHHGHVLQEGRGVGEVGEGKGAEPVPAIRNFGLAVRGGGGGQTEETPLTPCCSPPLRTPPARSLGLRPPTGPRR